MMRRKVTEVLETFRQGREFVLRLACGHEVKRRDNGNRKAPKSTYCDACQMVLDRLDQVEGGIASVRQLKSTQAILRFLEKEGYVEGVQPIASQAVYWKKAKNR